MAWGLAATVRMTTAEVVRCSLSNQDCADTCAELQFVLRSAESVLQALSHNRRS